MIRSENIPEHELESYRFNLSRCVSENSDFHELLSTLTLGELNVLTSINSQSRHSNKGDLFELLFQMYKIRQIDDPQIKEAVSLVNSRADYLMQSYSRFDFIGLDNNLVINALYECKAGEASLKQAYDKDQLEHAKKSLKKFIQKVNSGKYNDYYQTKNEFRLGMGKTITLSKKAELILVLPESLYSENRDTHIRSLGYKCEWIKISVDELRDWLSISGKIAKLAIKAYNKKVILFPPGKLKTHAKHPKYCGHCPRRPRQNDPHRRFHQTIPHFPG